MHYSPLYKNFIQGSVLNHRLAKILLSYDYDSLYEKQLAVESFLDSSWADVIGCDYDHSAEEKNIIFKKFWCDYKKVLSIGIKAIPASKAHKSIPLIEISIEDIAVEVFNVMFRSLITGEDIKYTDLSCKIGNSVLLRWVLLSFRDKFKGQKTTKDQWYRYVESAYGRLDGDITTYGANLGLFLVEVALDCSNLIERVTVRCSTEKTETLIRPNLKLIESLKVSPPLLGCKLPMVIEPVQWSDENFGGYLLNNDQKTPLIHQNSYNVSLEHSKFKSKIDYRNVIYGAVNKMQSVAFRISVRLLEWVDKNGLDLGIVSSYPDMSKGITKDNAVDLAKFCRERNVLGIAKLYENCENIYFPLFIDWRGRIYSQTHYLTFQGCSLSKALLEFSKGSLIYKSEDFEHKRVTDVGYIKIHGANTYGLGSKSLKERVDWVNTHIEDIIGMSKDFIVKAKNPLLFAAFCLEFKAMMESFKSSDTFETHLPIQLDASCNGIQHLASMICDTSLSTQVNLSSANIDDRPYDFYVNCLNNVLKTIEEKFKDKYNPFNGLNIDRTMIKKSIMTIPYNVTQRGIVEQLIEFFDKTWVVNEYVYTPKNKTIHGDVKLSIKEISFISDVIYKTLYKNNSNLNNLVIYLTQMVKLLNDLEMPIVWVTPSGMQISQNYPLHETYRFKSNLFKGGTKITLRIPTDAIDKTKQKQSFMPNLVHSLDGSVIAIMLAKYQGYNIFTIHDCFATTANNVDYMCNLVRSVFISLYADQCYIDKLHDLIITYIGSRYEIVREDDKHVAVARLGGDKLIIPTKPVINHGSYVNFLENSAKNAIYMIH